MISLSSFLTGGNIQTLAAQSSGANPQLRSHASQPAAGEQFTLPSNESVAAEAPSPLLSLLNGLTSIKNTLTSTPPEPSAGSSDDAPVALAIQEAVSELVNFDLKGGKNILRSMFASLNAQSAEGKDAGAALLPDTQVEAQALTPEVLVAALDTMMVIAQDHLAPSPVDPMNGRIATMHPSPNQASILEITTATTPKAELGVATEIRKTKPQTTPQKSLLSDGVPIVPFESRQDTMKPLPVVNEVTKLIISEAQRVAQSPILVDQLRPSQQRGAASIRTSVDLDFVADLASRFEIRDSQIVEKPMAPDTQNKPNAKLASNLIGQIQTANLGDGRTRVDLSPRGLGAVSIEMSTSAEGAVSVVVRVENPTVLTSLRDARDMLEFALGVGDGDSLDFQDLGQQQDQQREDQVARNGTSTKADGGDEAAVDATAPSQTDVSGTGRLDLVT